MEIVFESSGHVFHRWGFVFDFVKLIILIPPRLAAAGLPLLSKGGGVVHHIFIIYNYGLMHAI